MAEVSKEDIIRIFSKLDAQTDCLTDLKVDMAVVKQKVEDIPKVLPRPCSFHEDLKGDFLAHVTDHKDNASMIKRPAIGLVVDLVKMGVVGAVCYMIGKK